MGDEYLVIPVFLSGIVFQAFLVSRSMAGAATAATLAGLSLALAWYVTREETDQNVLFAVSGGRVVRPRVRVFFASNVLYLLLLIPVSDRHRFWESVLGSNHDAAREHRDALAAKMSSQKISMFQAMLLALHAAALVVNYRWELVTPGLFMNVAVVATAVLSLTDGAPDGDERGPLRMLASRTE